MHDIWKALCNPRKLSNPARESLLIILQWFKKVSDTPQTDIFLTCFVGRCCPQTRLTLLSGRWLIPSCMLTGTQTSKWELESGSFPQLIATWRLHYSCKVMAGCAQTCTFALSPLSSCAPICTSSLNYCHSLQKGLGGSRCFPAPPNQCWL